MPIPNIEGEGSQAKFPVDESRWAALSGRPCSSRRSCGIMRQRQRTVATKDRGEVEGSTKKLYAQKHTGNARRGNIRTNLMTSGGVTLTKARAFSLQDLPLKQRRLTHNLLILSKIISGSRSFSMASSFPKIKPKSWSKCSRRRCGSLGADRHAGPRPPHVVPPLLAIYRRRSSSRPRK